jgi:hypothetical protein
MKGTSWLSQTLASRRNQRPTERRPSNLAMEPTALSRRWRKERNEKGTDEKGMEPFFQEKEEKKKREEKGTERKRRDEPAGSRGCKSPTGKE